MTENIEGVEFTWDNNQIYMRFTDLFGGHGKNMQYSFAPEEFQTLIDLAREALMRYKEGL